MTLLSEIEEFFQTKNLYEAIGVDKGAKESEIKKAYRKASLKIHPDRVPEGEKEHATKKFQVLARVHFVLSDAERRKLYDDHGIIANEDALDSEADWDSYWRLLFPRITKKDIDNFMDTYVGSEDEKKDLIDLYNKYEGDLDKISESHISYDEERTVALLKELISAGDVTGFKEFTNEKQSKKARRVKRAQREAGQAEKAKEEIRERTGQGVENFDDLQALIQRRSANFDSMLASLEAKYCGNKRGTKRKRT